MRGIIEGHTVHENKMATIERETDKSLYAAHGGIQAALNQLDSLINTSLTNTISNANPSSVINYTQSRVASDDGIGWLLFSVRDSSNNPLLVQNTDLAEYSQNSTSLGDYIYQYTIIFYFADKIFEFHACLFFRLVYKSDLIVVTIV